MNPEIYRYIFDAIEGPAFLHDEQFRVLLANRAYCREAGVTEKEAQGKPYWEVFPRGAGPLPGCLRSLEERQCGEELLRLSSGDEYVSSSSPICDAEGKYLCSLHVMQDVTEKRKAEAEQRTQNDALRESESRLRVIMESVHTGIVIIEPDTHKIVDVNASAASMIGAPKEEIVGSVCHRFICPAENGKCPITDLHQTVDHSERVLLTSAGVRRPVIKSVTTVMLGGKEHLLESYIDITELKEHEVKLNRLNLLLLTIRNINEYLLVTESEEALYHFVCETLKGFDDIVGVVIAIKLPDYVLKPVAWAGFSEEMISALVIRWDDSMLGSGIMGIVAREGKLIVAADIENDVRYLPWRDIVQHWQLKSAVAVPLIADGEVMGVLALYSGHHNGYDEETINFLAEVAGDVAVGVRSLRLDKNLQVTLDHLRSSMNSTVEAIASMVELRDPYTAGHERRVAQLASAIGKEMSLPERQVEGLRVIGYVHDIGKISVPAEILSKPTALTEVERMMLKSHAKTGYDILAKLEFPWPVAQAVLQHHERLDGSGYPQGLKAQDIIIEARILMVADVIEAMASHRPYRASLGLEVAINEITANKGNIYDSEVVTACVRLFAEHRFNFDEGN